MLRALICLSTVLFLPCARAQDSLLITNVRVFTGTSADVKNGSVLLVKDRIAEVGSTIIPTRGTVVVDGGGRFLMPGLIDAHWHTFMGPATMAEMMDGDVGYLHTLAAAEAESTLLRGFTTVRDAAGPAFGLKRAIDKGIVPGPRIYPSGAMISQTSGHGDFRSRGEAPLKFGGYPDLGSRLGAGVIADGRDAVLTAVREQLRLGASQVKLAAGGGISSFYDPIDVNQYTADELRAAVEAAADWGTYVIVHIYTDEGIRRAIDAGVKSIEHGQMASEATMQLMAEKNIWLSMQPFTDAHQDHFSADQNAKLKTMTEGTGNAYTWAKKHNVKLAFGTDKLWGRKNCADQSKEMAKLLTWFTPFEILNMATAKNGELMKLSGPRDPYPAKLGVIEPGAYADLLLVNGDPLKDITVLEDPAKNLVVIIKDGKVVKDVR
jgi:imidazolonepropionase-like amidohydrolase